MNARRQRLIKPRSIRSVVVLALGLAIAPASAAWAHGPDPVLSDKLFAQNQVLEFRWRSGSEPPAAIKTAIRGAAEGLNASRASKAATFVYATGGANPIGYGPGATCGVNGIACFTRSAPNGFTMWLREQGRVFDWGTLKWCQMYASAPNGCYDAETIALDEFGHIEVLAHHVNHADDRDYLDAVVQTYSRTKPKTGWDEHVLGRCDVATLQREYDVPSASTKISTCLALDTTVTLATSATAVVHHTSVKFTAVLRIASNSAYDRLSGNDLSGRTVKLQRRPPGSTTWATIATMTAGSPAGTYTATAVVATTGEYRALFSAPSSEGLAGDGSPVVTVRALPCAGAPCVLAGRP